MGFTFKIILRKNLSGNGDKMHIVTRIIINRKAKFYFLKLQTRKNDWSSINGRVKGSDPNSDSKNIVIDNWKERLSALYFEYRRPEYSRNINFLIFERDFFQTNTTSHSFYTFIIEEIILLTPLREKGTIYNYEKLLVKLKEFRNETLFQELNLTFIERFHKFLCEFRKSNNKPLEESTIYKFHKDLRMFVNRALSKKLIKDYAYENFVVKEKFKSNVEVLSIKEIDKLYETYCQHIYKQGKQKVLRNFLTACYSAFSFSDFIELRYKNIQSKIIEGETYKYIKGKRYKTDEEYIVPIVHKRLIELIGNGFPEQRIFETLENQPTNKYIKTILTDAGITKKLTFHDSRHTYRTIADKKEIRPSIIKKIMGHADGDISDTYNHITLEDVIQEANFKWKD